MQKDEVEKDVRHDPLANGNNYPISYCIDYGDHPLLLWILGGLRIALGVGDCVYIINNGYICAI
jgi:hypothetical protein